MSRIDAQKKTNFYIDSSRTEQRGILRYAPLPIEQDYLLNVPPKNYSPDLPMDNESGQLSIDFSIGFAIFMIGFIFVATLVSGLLIGLQSKTIDYDAVAYRTSVILGEDPGEPRVDPYALNPDLGDQPWELIENSEEITRFGLAISKEHPGVLSGQKVDRFFEPGEFSKEELRDRLLLSESGQYPYHFNVTLSGKTPVGDPLPESGSLGYIRRAVFIKDYQYAAPSLANPSEFVNISINFSELQSAERGAIYGVNLQLEPVEIVIVNESTSGPVNLTNVFLTPPDDDSFIYEDNIPVRIDNAGAASSAYGLVVSTIEADFGPGHFSGYSAVGEVILHFQFNAVGNNLDTKYTLPPLRNATLEVWIW